ncbi:MAG: hypothetical protein ACD_21C00058G0012 [uncultured bacterium]|nr:MAG: hypothetical protein ACD_21C00058G0012 [uncultured bacterium]
MLNMNKYFLLVAAVVFIIISGCKQSEDFPDRPATNAISATESSGAVVSDQPIQPAQFCPQVGELTKQNDVWGTPDNKWRSFTHSSAKKILNFLGAQWVGVKVGKIICLYQTDEAVSFPLAVEQLVNQSILEPVGYGWSALTNGRKFCKSASVADCTYFIEPQKGISNIYEEIKYNPREDSEL